MKRTAVIKKLRQAAKRAGKDFEVTEWTNHTAIRVGNKVSTIGRHSEIPDNTVRKYFDQYSEELGKGWWR